MTMQGAQQRIRRARLEALNAAARSSEREHAESIIRGIDALTRKIAAIEHLPLDVLDRYQRILTAAHVGNLLRLQDYSGRELVAAEEGGDA